MPESLRLSRRQFLRRLGYAAATAATLEPLRRLNGTTNPSQPLKVVVVGAGLSGLCAAYELEQRGHEVTILEARTSHVGGRVRTMQFGNGLYGELGAMRIPLKHELTRFYAAKFGLTLRRFVQSNPEAFYYVRGHRFRVKDEIQANQYYALSEAEKNKSVYDLYSQSVVRILGEMTEQEKADLRRVIFQTAKVRELDNISLEYAFKSSGLSAEAIEMLSVLWAEETSLITALTVILREENELTWALDFDEIVGGTERLPYAFLDQLKSKPRMGAEVFRIEQDAARGKAAALYRENGTINRVEGDLLLCTLPLGVMTRVEFDPPLSGPKNRAMRQATYDSSTKVLAVATRRFWETEEGIYGGGTYTDLPTAITYYPSDNAAAKDPAVARGSGVMLASYTWGQPARRLAVLPHAERSQFVLDTLALVHPQLKEAGLIDRTASWAWDNDPYSSGAFCWFTPGQHETLYQHLVSPEGRLFFAGEHSSLTPTWMQGALESGLRAVQQMLTAPNWLRIAGSPGGKARMSWPSSLSSYQLESAPALQPGNWTAVTNATVSDPVEVSTTVDATSGGARFFRLAPPAQ